ncbi:hypothetical protein LguiB_014407 [Lonicera macranthoides]
MKSSPPGYRIFNRPRWSTPTKMVIVQSRYLCQLNDTTILKVWLSRIIAAMRSSVCYRARATHVSGQNPGSIPSSSCCSALASVVESQPQCLCVFLNAGSFYGIPFDPQLARALPAACNVQTPPATSGKHAKKNKLENDVKKYKATGRVLGVLLAISWVFILMLIISYPSCTESDS